VVILRNVDVGETVAASTQSPDLFTIARDLREMQVKTSVDEADIGQVRIGQNAVFTVDSFPGREFRGTVGQIRKSPKIEQSVVSYDVMISAENADLRLLPGMTANVRIIVQAYDNALKAPNAALRFRPLDGDPAAKLAPAAGPGPGGAQNAGPPPGAGGPPQRGPRRRPNPDAQIARLTESLGLSEAQQTQIRDIITSAGPELRRMRQSGASPQEIRDFLQNARRENRAKIAELLSEEQRATFNALVQRRATQPRTRAVLWLLDEMGAAKPVSVLAGASDGSATQIIAGAAEVADGRPVITGYDRAPPAPSDGSASFRRRFGF
jgi:HlyD family secretion protein